nr:reverse transcriptase domain-containing protein [Tanacetum cinerariifolium]
MSTLAEFMILSGGDNHPPMLEKHLYDSWKSRMELYMKNKEHGRMILESVEHGPLIWPTIEENGVTMLKKYKELYATDKIQADCDLKATNINFQVLPLDFYSLVNHHRVNQQTHLAKVPQIDFGLAIPVFKQGDDPIDVINKMMSFLSTVITSRFLTTNNQLRNSSNPRQQATILDGRVIVQPVQGRQSLFAAGTSRKRANILGTWGNNSSQQRVVKCFNCQGEAQGSGKVLNEEELELLADPGVVEGPVTQTIIIHNAAYQANDLDAYDSYCDDFSTGKAVLMSNLSSYRSDVLSEVPHSENTHSDMLNQSVQEMSYYEQTHLVNYPENEITNFGKHFIPQQELSDEQAFWLHTSQHNTDQSASSVVKIRAPQELPKKGNGVLNTLKLFSKRNNSIFKDLKNVFNVFDKDIFNEVMEVQTVFNQMKVVVQQYYAEKHIKNDLRKFKGKDIVDNATQVSNATPIAPGMYKLDPVTLALKDKNNRETHIYYLKHTIKQADILREIVEQAKSLNLLDSASYSACGTFMKRRPEECYDLIENMTAHHNDWDTSAQQTIVGQTHNVYATGAYQGGNSYQPQVERETEVTKDTVPPTNNRSTNEVQPPVVQIKTPMPNSEPVVAPIIEPVAAPTERALIDVFKGELTLHDGKEAITFNLDQTSRYSANYNDMTENRIDVIDMACEEYSQEVFGFSDVIVSSNPTPYYDSIVSTSSLTLTPFGDSDFLLEEVDAFLALEDDATSSKVELKDLPHHLEYVFSEGDDKLPVIIAKDLSVEEKVALIKHQRMVNPKIHDVIKKEVLKLLDAGLIYPISDSPSVSPVHCVPKKGGFTVVENEENELIPNRLVTGWCVCIDYRKLNKATRKDYFPLPFMDQMLERLARNDYYCFLDGFLGHFQIPIDPKDQEKTAFTYLTERLPTVACLLAYVMHKARSKGV